jgi:integrase
MQPTPRPTATILPLNHPTRSWPPSMPQKPKLPHVERTRVKGRVYFYVRIKGRRIARLPDDPETPEFFEAYAAALRQHASDPKPSAHAEGSIAWVIQAYKSSGEYRGLAAKTQTSYAREMDRLAAIGTFPAADIRRRHIRAIREKLDATPRTQQMFGQVCSLLFNFAIRELEIDMINPATKLRRSDDPDSYVAWSEAERATFEASSPPVELMTAYMIARYTGPRRGDAVALRRSDYDGKWVRIRGAKTNTPVTVLAHERLKAHLDALPAALTLIADKDGRPVSPDQLSKRMRAHLDGIGLTGRHFHGLRHTAATELFEAGNDPQRVAAVLGHKTLQMVERYTKTANRTKLAEAAILTLEASDRKKKRKKQ